VIDIFITFEKNFKQIKKAMKKLIYLFVIVLVVVVSCKKDNTTTTTTPTTTLNPVQKQWGFVLEYTATWCYYCGQWGASTMDTLCNSSHYVAGISCHASSDPMYNATLNASFEADRTDGGGIPSFWIGDNANYDASTLSSLLAQTATAALDLNYTKSGSTITVNTETKFFTAGTGNYFLSVYLIESGIDGSTTAPTAYVQNNPPNPATYVHKRVLRTSSIPSNAFGESIVNGSVAAGKTINKTYTLTVDPTWTKTLNVIAVLWNYNSAAAVPQYKFVNCIQK